MKKILILIAVLAMVGCNNANVKNDNKENVVASETNPITDANTKAGDYYQFDDRGLNSIGFDEHGMAYMDKVVRRWTTVVGKYNTVFDFKENGEVVISVPMKQFKNSVRYKMYGGKIHFIVSLGDINPKSRKRKDLEKIKEFKQTLAILATTARRKNLNRVNNKDIMVSVYYSFLVNDNLKLKSDKKRVRGLKYMTLR